MAESREPLILENIARHIELSREEAAHFMSTLGHKRLRKKEVLVQEGQISKYTYFVEAGCLRGYTVDPNGDEHILSFAPAGWWIADIYSLLSGRPGQLNIDALEDSDIFLLPRDSQEQLYRSIPKFERFFRIIIEKSMIATQQRLLDNLSLSAEERYEAFARRYPTLVHSLPQKQIAAYLGITPEFFSKMRSRMLRK